MTGFKPMKEIFSEIKVTCCCTKKVTLPQNYLAVICPNCGCKVKRPNKDIERKF
jgi:predicted RNA-binding Zn-ribbon protein involved in translation (DUF1610 family)